MPGTGAGMTWDARLSTPGSPVCTPDWLALREPADAAARVPALVDRLRPHLPDGPLTVRDLGCGTGSMGRWLAPLLAGPHQHWVLHDRDATLLDRVVIRRRHDPRPASATSPTSTPGGLPGRRW